jgi:hypothetical protein
MGQLRFSSKDKEAANSSHVACSRFHDYCQQARRADVGGAVQFQMDFLGVGTIFQKRADEESGRYDEDSESAEDDQVFSGEESEESDEELRQRSNPRLSKSGVGLPHKLEEVIDADDLEGPIPTADRGSISQFLEADEDEEVEEFDVFQGRAERTIRKSEAVEDFGISSEAAAYFCNRRNHPTYLRDKVYARRCGELGLHINSGVDNCLLKSTTCFCNLEECQLSNLLLGDRGVLGVLPLFKSGRRMKSLSLVGNGIRDKGMKDVMAALQDPGILLLLSVLDLSRNPITSRSAPDLQSLQSSRPQVLMLGLKDTCLPNVRRQFLLRTTIARFAATETNHMVKTWRLASPENGFVDSELWMQCTPIIEEHCTREQLAECLELLTGSKATKALEGRNSALSRKSTATPGGTSTPGGRRASSETPTGRKSTSGRQTPASDFDDGPASPRTHADRMELPATAEEFGDSDAESNMMGDSPGIRSGRPSQ